MSLAIVKFEIRVHQKLLISLDIASFSNLDHASLARTISFSVYAQQEHMISLSRLTLSAAETNR